MAESYVEVTEGSGKKLWTETTLVGADTKHAEIVKLWMPYLASYRVRVASISGAVANEHLLQIMAGSSLNVYIHRIWVYQRILAATAALVQFDVVRLSTAGTGGTGGGIFALDPADSGAGASSMSLPTVKGTESNIMDTQSVYTMQT